MKRDGSFLPFALLITVAVIGCGSDASGDPVVESLGSAKSIVVDNFNLSWTIEDGYLNATMSAPTTGWVAIGFEPSAAMKDADIVIGYVAGGEVYVSDDWGDGHISHRADTDLGGTSDVTQTSGSESNGETEISFRIPMNSGDEYDRVLQEGQTFKVILAFGPDDADDFQGYHVWAETIDLEL